MFIAVRLAKSGYFEGNPERVLQAPCDIVLQILKFEAEEKRYLKACKAIKQEGE